jgi:hypothetical protein
LIGYLEGRFKYSFLSYTSQAQKLPPKTGILFASNTYSYGFCSLLLETFVEKTVSPQATEIGI